MTNFIYNSGLFATICNSWPIEALALIYLISMFFLIKLFARTYKIIKVHPGNGLEFYRKLVAIAIAVTMIDATYVVISRFLHWFYPNQDYMLYGIIPTIVKTLILVCVWGFYNVQAGKTPKWLSWVYWKEKFKISKEGN